MEHSEQPVDRPGPRRRWLVDGMNVVGSRPDGWWNDPERAMRSLTRTLDEWAEALGDDVTVVFDKAAPGLEAAHVKIVFARWKGRNAADHEIEVIVSEDADPGGISVVTSDKRLIEKVRGAGAQTVPSGRFRKKIDGFEKGSRRA